MFLVDLVHRHFKHIVAADADAVDFHWGFFAGLRRAGMLRMSAWLRVAHFPNSNTNAQRNENLACRLTDVAKTCDIPPKLTGILTPYRTAGSGTSGGTSEGFTRACVGAVCYNFCDMGGTPRTARGSPWRVRASEFGLVWRWPQAWSSFCSSCWQAAATSGKFASPVPVART